MLRGVFMPRFLLPIFILALVSSTGLGFVVLKLDPEQTSSVILFLVTLFLSIALTLSLIFFFVHKKFFFKPRFQTALGPVVIDPARGWSSSGRDLRPLFRTSLRNATLLAALITLLLILQRFL